MSPLARTKHGIDATDEEDYLICSIWDTVTNGRSSRLDFFPNIEQQLSAYCSTLEFIRQYNSDLNVSISTQQVPSTSTISGALGSNRGSPT